MSRLLPVSCFVIFLFVFSAIQAHTPDTGDKKHSDDKPAKLTSSAIRPHDNDPYINAYDPTGLISACEGSVAANPNIQTLVFEAISLVGNVKAEVGDGFEVSRDPNTGYAKIISFAPKPDGSIDRTKIYIRSTASAKGRINGTVILSSPGAISRFIYCSAVINPPMQADHIDDQVVKNGQSTMPVHFTGGANTYTWTNDNPDIGCPSSGTGDVFAFLGLNGGSTPVKGTFTVNATQAQLLYAPGRPGVVAVINTITNQHITDIPTRHLVTGIVIGKDDRFVYATGGLAADDGLLVINTTTNTVVDEINTGPTGFGVLSLDGKKLYVGAGNKICVIDLDHNTVEKTIPISKYALGLALSPDGTKLYAAIGETKEIAVISTLSDEVTGKINLTFGPLAIAFTPDGKKAYVSSRNSRGAAVIDASVNTAIKYFNDIFTGNSGICISPDGSTVYIPEASQNGQASNIAIINTVTDIATKVSTGGTYDPSGIFMNEDGSRLYYSSGLTQSVNMYETVNYTLLKSYRGVTGYPNYGNYLTHGKTTYCSVPVSFTITVNSAVPYLTTGAVSGTISACAGSPSAAPALQQFTIKGGNLTAPITVTAPANFEISLSPNNGYTTALNIAVSNGDLSEQAVYVRSAATANGLISGNVVLKTPDLPDKNIAVKGFVNPLPTITQPADQLIDYGQASTPVTFEGTGNYFTWVNDQPGIGLPAAGNGSIPSFTGANPNKVPLKATITVTPKKAGVAYIANSNSNTVSVINTLNHEVIKTIGVGHAPAGIAISHDGSRVYIGNSDAGTISVISTATNTVTGTLVANPSIMSLCLSLDDKLLYVANNGGLKVLVIDTQSGATLTSIPVKNPFGLTISPDGKTLYAVAESASGVSVINTENNAVTGNIDVGITPWGIAISTSGDAIYVANNLANTVSVIEPLTNKTVKNYAAGHGPVGVALSPDNKLLYVTDILANSVRVIDVTADKFIADIPVGNTPSGISVTPDGKEIYVTNRGSNTVSIINAVNYSVSTVNVGNYPNSYGNFILAGSGCEGPPVQFSITVKSAPEITVTGTLPALSTTYGTPSAAASFTVSGTSIKNGISLTAPAGYELGFNKNTFSSTLSINVAGTVPTTTVYIRLAAATAAGSYNNSSIIISSPAVADVKPLVNGVVNPASLTVTTPNITKYTGTALTDISASDNFTVTGLQNGETIGTVSIHYGQGAATNAALGVYTGSVVVSNARGGTFSAANYAITYQAGNITVNEIPPAPALTITGNLSPFSTTYGTASATESFSVAGTHLTGPVTIAAPEGYEISTDGTTFTTSAVLPPSGGNASATIYIRLTDKAGAGMHSGPIAISSPGAGSPSSPSAGGQVLPAPLTVTISGKTKTYGSTIASQGNTMQFTAEGLRHNETIGSISIAYADGFAANAPAKIYASVVTPSGATGGTFNAANYAITYFPASLVINQAQLTIAADNQQKVYGMANPPLTITYTGFVNNEGPAQLSILPQISTTATADSPPGNYDIIVSGASATNYAITQNNGILTITAKALTLNIPNTFTPNGDGVNDTWVIGNISSFPGSTVNVFNRFGTRLFTSVNYGVLWDGRYQGTDLPSGVYYYVIDTKGKPGVLSGYITILR